MDLGTVGQYGDNLLKPPPKTDRWMHRWIMIHLIDCGTVLVKSAQVTSQLVCIYTAGSGYNSSAPAAATRVDLGTFLTTRSESLMNPVRPMITLGLVCPRLLSFSFLQLAQCVRQHRWCHGAALYSVPKQQC